MSEEVYMEAPVELVPKEQQQTKVLRLRKALYGLKQSGREWNILLISKLQQTGWIQSLYDQCLFSRTTNDEESHVIVYVDDV